MAGVESAPSLSRKYQLVIDFVFTAEAEMPTFSDVGQIHLVANFEVDVSEAWYPFEQKEYHFKNVSILRGLLKAEVRVKAW